MNRRGSVVVFALLFVIALSILGVVLFKLGYIAPAQQANYVNIPSKTAQTADPVTANIEKVTPEDDVDSIDKDLKDTDINTMDQEVLGVKTESDAL